jgi:hypothetical protein
MIGLIFINEDIIGEADFKVTDGSMGVIGGEMVAYDLYNKYRLDIQKSYESKGIANVEDFNFRINIAGRFIDHQGGIGITDCPGFKPYVESAGNDLNELY